jgi:DNA repair exonuclease SbcCD ATPase subunit
MASGVTTRSTLSTSTPGEKTQKPRTSPGPNVSSKGQEGELASIHTQLKEIKRDLKKTLKADDIKELITNVVEDLFKKHQDKIDKNFNDKVEHLKQENSELKDSIIRLESEKRALKHELDETNEALNDIHVRLAETENMSKSALAKANQNEQYSRKFNVKIYGIPESHGEDPLESVNEALKDIGAEIQGNDVTAIHRIPGKQDEHRPIIIKFHKPAAKAQIMKKRSDIKKLHKGWKISDDVTKANATLISSLNKDERISSAWYFNGSVYGQCGNRRIKFDIFDDIERKLKNK